MTKEQKLSFKHLKKDISNGTSKEESLSHYINRENADISRAYRYLVNIPDLEHIKKYSIVNFILMFLYGITTLGVDISALPKLVSSFIASGTTFSIFLVFVFLLEFGLHSVILYLLYKRNAIAYLIVAILTIRPLAKVLVTYLKEPSMALIIGIALYTLIIILAIFIKIKLFPYQNLFHSKKDINGNSIYSMTRKEESKFETKIENEDSPEKKEKKKKTSWLAIIGIVVIVIFIYLKSFANTKENNAKYEAQDTYNRQFAPDNFDIDLLTLTDRNQSEIINEYKLKGFDLKCFSHLRSREKISKQDDYLCWALTKNTFGIPSKQMALFFSNKKLTNVRIEFPDSSFYLLQKHLKEVLSNQYRYDLAPGNTIKKSIMSWKADHGVINTNKTTKDKTIILWTSVNVLSPTVQEEFY